jgi:hypothetical protein
MRRLAGVAVIALLVGAAIPAAGEFKGKYQSIDVDEGCFVVTGDDGKDMTFYGPGKIVGADGKPMALGNIQRIKKGTPVAVTYETKGKLKVCTVLKLEPKDKPADKK